MKRLLLLLTALCVLLAGCASDEPEILFDEATEGLVSVILEDTNDCTIHYDTVGPMDGDTRLRQETAPFESEPMEICHSLAGSFDSSMPALYDADGNPVEVTEEYARIFRLASETGQSILSLSIYQLENEIFAVAEWNVNFWSPYVLYYYDAETDSLAELYRYDSTRIIGLKPLNI